MASVSKFHPLQPGTAVAMRGEGGEGAEEEYGRCPKRARVGDCRLTEAAAHGDDSPDPYADAAEDLESRASDIFGREIGEVSQKTEAARREEEYTPGDVALPAVQQPGFKCGCPSACLPSAASQRNTRAAVLLLRSEDDPIELWNSSVPLLKASELEVVPSTFREGVPEREWALEDGASALSNELGHMPSVHLVAVGAAVPAALALAARSPRFVRSLVLACAHLPGHTNSTSGGSGNGEDGDCTANAAAKDLDKLCAKIGQPTLCLSSDEDPHQAATLALASKVPDCRYQDLGCKAFPVVDSDPKIFVQNMIEFFLEDCGGRPPPLTSI